MEDELQPLKTFGLAKKAPDTVRECVYGLPLCFYKPRLQVCLGVMRIISPYRPEGRLHVIGGGIQPGETHEEALTREIREEAGMDSWVKEYVGRVDHVSTQFQPHLHVQSRQQYYYLVDLGEKVCAPAEDDHRLEWIPIQGAENMLVRDSAKFIVQYARKFFLKKYQFLIRE